MRQIPVVVDCVDTWKLLDKVQGFRGKCGALLFTLSAMYDLNMTLYRMVINKSGSPKCTTLARAH
jgi:hypothetical protein